MWAAVVEVELPMNFGQGPSRGLGWAARRAGVLVVWAGLALIRPRLARRIWRDRYASERSWPSGLTLASQRKVVRGARPR
jgi:hypothetical protein